jgi:hypothetical protein
MILSFFTSNQVLEEDLNDKEKGHLSRYDNLMVYQREKEKRYDNLIENCNLYLFFFCLFFYLLKQTCTVQKKKREKRARNEEIQF